MKKGQLVKKVNKEIKDTEFAINHRILCNIKNIGEYAIIKTGATIAKGIPIFLSSIICFNMFAKHNARPFKTDTIPKPTSVTETITSNGEHLVKSSLDYEYDEFSLTHSTKWYINDLGLYERIETKYVIDKELLESNLTELLELSNEELAESFYKKNIYTIQKSELEPNDNLYNEEVVLASYSYDDYSKTSPENEPIGRELTTIVLYLILTFLTSMGFDKISKIIFKENIRSGFARLETKYKYIKKSDIEELQKSLVLKKQNLKKLTGDIDEKDQNKPIIKPHTLNKKRRDNHEK